MSRPVKEGVDYFSHDTASGKTIFTLESRFGNDGYAFWFKLLELLGTQAGLYCDCRSRVNWLYLVAKTRVDEDTARGILELLASLDAIDAALWRERVIWVPKFAQRLAEVYRKRRVPIPERPDFRTENRPEGQAPGAENAQRKGKQRTANKSKAKESTGEPDAALRARDLPDALTASDPPDTRALASSELSPERDCPVESASADGDALSDTMRAKLREWLAYKAERREPYKQTGLRSLVTELARNAARWGEEAVLEVIGESMAANYKGIVFDRLKRGTAAGAPESELTRRKRVLDEKIYADLEAVRYGDNGGGTQARAGDPELLPGVQA